VTSVVRSISAAVSCLALLSLGCSGNIDGGNSGPGGTPTGPGGTPTGPGGTSTGPGGTPTGPGGTATGPGGMGSPSAMYPAPPGHTPLRRLTRSQYNNTIRDLLGIVGDTAGDFGVDEEDAGFASNDRAPLTDGQLEKYQNAAEALADKAVANLGNLMKCAPGAAEADCVDQFIRSFGKRAVRRPLTDAEIGRYRALFTTGRTGGDLSSGIALVLSAILQSPYFLYRVELGEPGAAPGKDGVPLSQYEIGTRLAFFLTDSTPDDALLAAADAGKLRTAEGIAAEAQRLLMGPKGRDTLTSFYLQWLGMQDFLSVEKDPKAYPAFDPTVRAAMRDEVLEFVDQVTRVGDGKLLTLLTSHTSFLRGPLYPIYGFPTQGNAGGSIMKRVDLPPDERSGGVFTLTGVLAQYGHADQSSPVGRGKLISERLLCIEPADPPPGIAANVPPADPNVPTRVRFEKHRTDPMCAACHELMDPLGVTFENYDGIGRYRTTDGGKPVDATSELKNTKASNGPLKNAIDLLTKLGNAEETRTCFTRQMYRYAFGHAESDRDQAVVADGLGALGRTGRIPDLMIAIASAPGFRTRIPLDLK
jgi:hypothetical protein